MCVWCIYLWCLILMHVFMMHVSMVHLTMILDNWSCMYDACMYNTCECDPQSLTLIHVNMMHMSVIVPDKQTDKPVLGVGLRCYIFDGSCMLTRWVDHHLFASRWNIDRNKDLADNFKTTRCRVDIFHIQICINGNSLWSFPSASRDCKCLSLSVTQDRMQLT